MNYESPVHTLAGIIQDPPDPDYPVSLADTIGVAVAVVGQIHATSADMACAAIAATTGEFGCSCDATLVTDDRWRARARVDATPDAVGVRIETGSDHTARVFVARGNVVVTLGDDASDTFYPECLDALAVIRPRLEAHGWVVEVTGGQTRKS